MEEEEELLFCSEGEREGVTVEENKGDVEMEREGEEEEETEGTGVEVVEKTV